MRWPLLVRTDRAPTRVTGTRGRAGRPPSVSSIAPSHHRVQPSSAGGTAGEEGTAEFAAEGALWRVLQRERSRSDRVDSPLSLVLGPPPRTGAAAPNRPAELAAIASRLRCTDVVGAASGGRVGLILPHTGRREARAVARKVFLEDGPPVEIHTYPEDHFPSHEHLEPGRGRNIGVARPRRRTAVPRARGARGACFANGLPVWKRGLDLLGALAGLALLSPLFVTCALLVRLTSRGPVLFAQTRAGLAGRPFSMLKFRSMSVDAEAQRARLQAQNEAAGPVFKIERDPRITAVGRFLRKTSLDELPQLVNVLRGEMSLVGPRPPTFDEVERYADWQRRRLEVTPGITCIWQVNGRDQSDFDRWVRQDIQYGERRTLARDLSLILRTIPAVLSTRGAS